MRGQGHWAEGVPEETLTRAQAQQVLRRLFRMLRPYRASMVLVTMMLVGQVGALLAGPALVGRGIDAIKPGHHNRSQLDHAVLLYLVLAFLALVMGRLVIRLIARMGESFLRGLRMRVFQHLMTLS
ncbi:MAG: ATP-binding cassette, subfamily bacterial, partial [Actinomycetota bacterium]|nr:ATP-binding cassette, subfamily bacterial [Actinomycetota bacterium]